MATMNQALRTAQDAGLDRLDAQLLLLHAMDTPPAQASERRTWLLAHGEDALAPGVLHRFTQLQARRQDGEPLAYITGHKEFFGLTLQVDMRVLVPCADTETLVRWALEVLTEAQAGYTASPIRALDLGTGSGAIALALKHNQPRLQVVASDLSRDALALARINANFLGLEIEFVHGCWLDAAQGLYHCIVSNPPYIAAGDAHLPALRHEPASALVAGPDGLRDLRQIIAAAQRHLHPDGWLLLEHGYDQSAAVMDLLADAGFGNCRSRRDWGGHVRCSGGQLVAPAAGTGQW